MWPLHLAGCRESIGRNHPFGPLAAFADIHSLCFSWKTIGKRQIESILGTFQNAEVSNITFSCKKSLFTLNYRFIFFHPLGILSNLFYHFENRFHLAFLIVHYTFKAKFHLNVMQNSLFKYDADDATCWVPKRIVKLQSHSLSILSRM